MYGEKQKTFGNLGNEYIRQLLSVSHNSNTIIDVFDRYDEASVKNTERQRRQAAGGIAPENIM